MTYTYSTSFTESLVKIYKFSIFSEIMQRGQNETTIRDVLNLTIPGLITNKSSNIQRKISFGVSNELNEFYIRHGILHSSYRLILSKTKIIRVRGLTTLFKVFLFFIFIFFLLLFQ